MEIARWLELVVRQLVAMPEMVMVTEEQLGEKLYLQIHVDADDTGKVVGKNGLTLKGIKELLWAAGKKDGCVYFLESHIGTNRTGPAPELPRERQSLPEEDPDVIAWEFLKAEALAPETMGRSDVTVMAAWADKDWPEVRAYLLAQYGARMKAEAVQELRWGGNG